MLMRHLWSSRRGTLLCEDLRVPYLAGSPPAMSSRGLWVIGG